MSGVLLAYLCYVRLPKLPKILSSRMVVLNFILTEKYGFDRLYMKGIAPASISIGRLASALGDKFLIDGLVVNGTARMVKSTAIQLRKIQSGYLYEYAFTMIIGLLGLITYFYVQN